MKGRLIVPTALLFVGFGLACDDETVVQPEPVDHATHPVATVTVDPGTSQLKAGETLQMAATVKCFCGVEIPRAVTWSTGDAAIAAVNQNGFVTAMGPGTVEITATADGKIGVASLAVSLAVVDDDEEPVKNAAWIDLVPEGPVLLDLKQKVQFKAMAYDTEGAPQPTWPIEWSSAWPWVAPVESDGMVTAMSIGSTWIRAESFGASAKVRVHVNTPLPPIVTVTIVPDRVVTVPGEEIELTPVAKDAFGNRIFFYTTWETSDPAVAVVDLTGKVTTMGPGHADITATCNGVPGYAEIIVR